MTTGLAEQVPVYLTTREVANRYGVDRETVRLWMVEGVRRAGGVRIKLYFEQVGGHRKTTSQWIAEFLAACKGTGEPVSEVSPVKVDRQAVADQERLAARLKPRKRKE